MPINLITKKLIYKYTKTIAEQASINLIGETRFSSCFQY